MRISDWSSDVCSSDLTVEGKAMINGTAAQRAEIRRLVAWFDQDFYSEVTVPLLFERMQKRLVHRQPPDGGALRDAMNAAHNHPDYIDYLIEHRTWLAGATLRRPHLAAPPHGTVPAPIGGTAQ